MLLADILEITYDPDVQADLKLLELLVQWVVRLKGEEGCELANLQTACSAMVRIATSAIYGASRGPVFQVIDDQQPNAAAAHTEVTVNKSVLVCLREADFLRNRSYHR